MYTQVFFLKKSYINYEKEIISCAALYLSQKNEYYKKKLSDFLFVYHKNKMTGQLFKPMSDAQKNELTEQICIWECQILKVIGFKLELDMPYSYIKEFSNALNQPQEMQS